jgi:hypothetical protein
MTAIYTPRAMRFMPLPSIAEPVVDDSEESPTPLDESRTPVSVDDESTYRGWDDDTWLVGDIDASKTVDLDFVAPVKQTIYGDESPSKDLFYVTTNYSQNFALWLDGRNLPLWQQVGKRSRAWSDGEDRYVSAKARPCEQGCHWCSES